MRSTAALCLVATASARSAVGGDTGGTVGSAISAALQTLVRYLCDCCLGWVFYRSGVSAARATCEGAVLFFKHGKTLLKNMGRIFGMGLSSLLAIGGAFTGVFYLIMSRFPAAFETLAAEFAKLTADSTADLPAFLVDPSANTMMLVCAVVLAVMLWSVLHGAFVRPFVLVGVLRNYIASGMADVPDEASFRLLAGKSKKFDKLRAEI